MNYEYLQKRSEMGKQPLYCQQGPEICDSIQPNKVEQKKYILRNPVHQITQNTPTYFFNEINTVRTEYSNAGANHGEGGWPKDVVITDPEQTQRYRRKVEKEDNYLRCVRTCSVEIEHLLYQNNAVDLYGLYNVDLPRVPEREHLSCRQLNVYRDPESKVRKRAINSICWQPKKGLKFAVTYVDIDVNRVPLGSTDCFVWNVEYPLYPESVISPPSVLLDLQFSNQQPNVLAGGLIDGHTAWWDLRVGSKAQAKCGSHCVHRDLVSCVLFIHTKLGTEFFSGSPGGELYWWDTRKLTEPTEVMILHPVSTATELPNQALSYGACCLEYESTIPSRYMVGTENGYVLCGNRKGKTQFEKLPIKYEAHLGPVWKVERNPSFLKNFLTVGDWTMRVWSEDCRESAIMWSPPYRHKVNDATWSKGRLSVLVLAQSSGIISIWDLLRSQTEPVLTSKICDAPLLKLRMHSNSTHVACGSQDGNVYMEELSSCLTSSDKNDKVLLASCFDRESKREKILEARLREIRLKMRQAEGASPELSATEIDPTIGDRDLIDTTAEYFATVKKEMLNM